MGAVAIFAFASVVIAGLREKAKEKREDEYYERLNAGEPVDRNKTLHPVKTRLGRFFATIGDIIIFVAQVVRVKKWKVCPLVQMDLDDDIHSKA
jgi:hypothetical protein